MNWHLPGEVVAAILAALAAILTAILGQALAYRTQLRTAAWQPLFERKRVLITNLNNEVREFSKVFFRGRGLELVFVDLASTDDATVESGLSSLLHISENDFRLAKNHPLHKLLYNRMASFEDVRNNVSSRKRWARDMRGHVANLYHQILVTQVASIEIISSELALTAHDPHMVRYVAYLAGELANKIAFAKQQFGGLNFQQEQIDFLKEWIPIKESLQLDLKQSSRGLAHLFRRRTARKYKEWAHRGTLEGDPNLAPVGAPIEP